MPELLLTADRAELGRVFPWLDEQAAGGQIPPRLLHRMHVVLEEAVANAALHGFPSGQPGRIAVRLAIEPDAAVLLVEDTGMPFNPSAAPERQHAATLADLEPGGWGLTLIHKFCPGVAYQRQNGVNVLTLRFPLG
jgi:anti-sigma regulatory factor (Ser/Thr protein kinase)